MLLNPSICGYTNKLDELIGEQVIVFGASENGKAACNYLSNNNEILFVCDNDERKWENSIGCFKIVSPMQIFQNKSATIVVAVARGYREVVSWLWSIGISDVWHLVEYYDLVTEEKKVRIRRIPQGIPMSSYKNYDYTIKDKVKTLSNKGKTVLMLAYYYPPIGGSGVQRSSKFSKYLDRFGYKPIVVTRRYCEKGQTLDQSLLEDLHGIDVIRIQEEPVFPEEMSKDDYDLIMELFSYIGLEHPWLKEFWRHLEEKWETIPDFELIWVLSCIKFISKNVDLRDVSIVYTTVNPYSSALFGAYLKFKYGIKWVLDYRDPWCLNDYNMRTFYQFRIGTFDLEKELEIKLLNMADHVVSTSEVFCRDFTEYCPSIKTTCITNGYDEDDFIGVDANIHNDDTFIILFNGYIYDNYDLTLILEILNSMISEGAIDKDNICFAFNGSDPSKYKDFINNDKYGIVRYNGYLPHRKSIESLFSADILLLFGLFDEGAYASYSGKIFEYLRTGIPILSISSPYGVQHEMIEEHGHGITATRDDKERIGTFILRYYYEWKRKKNSPIYEPDEYVRSFSREVLTEKLANVFDKTLNAL